MENIKQLNKEVLAKNILAQKWPNQFSTIYYTGLLFNERMLVIEDNTFTVFYTKHFKPMPALRELQKKGVQPIKERLYIMNTTIQKDDNKITLNFMNEDNHQKNWIFKFYSNDLAEKWMFLFHELQEKCISKSIKTKESKSTNLSDYNSILSNLKYTNFPPELPNQEKNQRQQYGDQKTKKVRVKKIQQNSYK